MQLRAHLGLAKEQAGICYSAAMEGTAVVSANGYGGTVACMSSIAPRICSYRAPGRELCR